MGKFEVEVNGNLVERYQENGTIAGKSWEIHGRFRIFMGDSWEIHGDIPGYHLSIPRGISFSAQVSTMSGNPGTMILSSRIDESSSLPP